jgi:hypothetical protein
MGEQVEFYVLGIEYKCLPVGLLEMAHRQGALPSLQPIRLKVLAVDAPTSARFLIEAVTAASTTPIDLSQLEELKFDAEQDSIVNVVLPMVHPGKITITGPYRYAPWCAAALIIFYLNHYSYLQAPSIWVYRESSNALFAGWSRDRFPASPTFLLTRGSGP